jgi:hypothetical protein
VSARVVGVADGFQIWSSRFERPAAEAFVLDFVGSAVSEGLLDLGWLNRLCLLDPLRGDATFEAHRRSVEERAARVARAWRASPESMDEALASLPAGDQVPRTIESRARRGRRDPGVAEDVGAAAGDHRRAA